ncbi:MULTISPECIES: hypothetical protein [unclassified Sphingomonas]|jgi:hypothetical protein|uniref:hypothetical protein n=1 Tax=unclassified Sphingomonas TaxID=196159 RepID=UPI0025E68128|nr:MULTISPECIES: hypothetical protein [unclassified Sphingomonas]
MRDDEIYFYERAETELELAQRATHPLAVRAHYIIANHYLDRCYGGAPTLSGNDDDGVVGGAVTANGDGDDEPTAG